MSVHSMHPSLHEHGLADGCPRCGELAAQPFFTLDDTALSALIARTRDWMKDGALFPRGENETTAMRIVEEALNHMRTIQRIEGSA